MKANEFVKRFGWDVAQELLKNSWGEKLIVHVGYATDGFELTEIIVKDDLKKLIEAKELVENHGGVNGARKELANLCDSLIDCAYLCQAIQLVESC